jgi:hypothetical protein
MTIKASAGSAMLFAAGLLIGLAGTAPAIAASEDGATVSKSENATSGKSVRHGSRHLKKRYAYRKPDRAALKSDESKKPEEQQVADAAGGTPPAIPEWLANANAQMTAADAPPDSAKGMSEKANTVLQATADKPADAQAPAETGVVASDQLNDADRELQETPSSQAAATQGVVLASTSRPASDAQQATNDSSTLDKTSLIGKIFIAVGALLTVASAARMFMA